MLGRLAIELVTQYRVAVLRRVRRPIIHSRSPWRSFQSRHLSTIQSASPAGESESARCQRAGVVGLGLAAVVVPVDCGLPALVEVVPLVA
jgi:hypothetical protein